MARSQGWPAGGPARRGPDTEGSARPARLSCTSSSLILLSLPASMACRWHSLGAARAVGGAGGRRQWPQKLILVCLSQGTTSPSPLHLSFTLLEVHGYAAEQQLLHSSCRNQAHLGLQRLGAGPQGVCFRAHGNPRFLNPCSRGYHPQGLGQTRRTNFQQFTKGSTQDSIDSNEGLPVWLLISKQRAPWGSGLPDQSVLLIQWVLPQGPDVSSSGQGGAEERGWTGALEAEEAGQQGATTAWTLSLTVTNWAAAAATVVLRCLKTVMKRHKAWRNVEGDAEKGEGRLPGCGCHASWWHRGLRLDTGKGGLRSLPQSLRHTLRKAPSQGHAYKMNRICAPALATNTMGT